MPKNLPEDTIGQRIKKARLEKDWTIKYLAKVANVNEVTVSKYEKDAIKNHTLSILRKLSQALNISMKYLSDYNQLPENTLGQKIRKYRLLKGLDYEELAKKVNLDPSTVLRIENNKTKNPYPKTIEKIEYVLNIKLL